MHEDKTESTAVSSPTKLVVAKPPARDFFDIARTPILYLAIAGMFALPYYVALAACLFVVGAHILKPGLRPKLSPRDVWKIPLVQKAIILFCTMMLCQAIDQVFSIRYGIHPNEIGALFLSLIPMACFGLYIKNATSSARNLLRQGRATAKQWQFWMDATYSGFITAFIVSVVAIVFIPFGPGQWIAHWLLASAQDANLNLNSFYAQTFNILGTHAHSIVQVLPPASIGYEFMVKTVLALVSSLMLWPTANRIAIFLTAFSKRLGMDERTSIADNFLRTLRAPSTKLKLREANPFAKNVAQSFWWLATCYLVLFWLTGFSTGPVGQTITGWLDGCISDAHTGIVSGASTNSNLRIFCAAIFALYGTVPVAVMGCAFLPYMKRREIELTHEGLMFPDGPYMTLGFRTMRLWSDLAHVDVKAPKKKSNPNNTRLVIKFHTGGKIVMKASQFAPANLDKLLGAIDEHANNCVVSDAAVALRGDVRAKLANSGSVNELGTKPATNFQSTIFVPHDLGAWLPNGETRVVRLLASRPLSCVYLVRMNSGKLAIAKQFFLSEDNEQHESLRKTFQREYELLKEIDHPKVSKVLDMFHRNESTYLLIEHAEGVDLSKLIAEEGPQAENAVIDWALEICDIMIALHTQDPPIVHRDLTPDNLILTEDGQIRIIDFGAAHQFMEGITGTIIGKQCYVPPEQLQGQAGPRSDIYSFGCTLHYLLTGREPVALSQCEPNRTANVFRSLNSLIMKCTEFDENNRPQTFDAVKSTILAIKEEKLQEPDRILRKLNDALLEATVSLQQETGTTDEEQAPPAVLKLKQTEEVIDECN